MTSTNFRILLFLLLLSQFSYAGSKDSTDRKSLYIGLQLGGGILNFANDTDNNRALYDAELDFRFYITNRLSLGISYLYCFTEKSPHGALFLNLGHGNSYGPSSATKNLYNNYINHEFDFSVCYDLFKANGIIAGLQANIGYYELHENYYYNDGSVFEKDVFIYSGLITGARIPVSYQVSNRIRLSLLPGVSYQKVSANSKPDTYPYIPFSRDTYLWKYSLRLGLAVKI